MSKEPKSRLLLKAFGLVEHVIMQAPPQNLKPEMLAHKTARLLRSKCFKIYVGFRDVLVCSWGGRGPGCQSTEHVFRSSHRYSSKLPPSNSHESYRRA